MTVRTESEHVVTYDYEVSQAYDYGDDGGYSCEATLIACWHDGERLPPEAVLVFLGRKRVAAMEAAAAEARRVELEDGAAECQRADDRHSDLGLRGEAA